MRIVIATDSFKESLPAPEVCSAIAAGFRSARPNIDLDLCPMADGGEGTVDALVAATGGEYVHTDVCGPLGEIVRAKWGLLGRSAAAATPVTARGEMTAVIEMAAASGLPLVSPERRNPLKTTTFGTGQLVRAALDRGARRILIGIGGSATTDGGAGFAQALGVRFLDAAGRVLPDGMNGESLARVAGIDLSRRDPRLSHTEIVVACDVDNPLCGPRGAAAVYGPQKGATPEIVRQLDDNLAHLAGLIRRDLGKDVADVAGAGAAGGLGAGLLAFCDAKMRRGVEIVIEATRLRERTEGADLLVTGEGRLDAQSAMGKLVAGVAAVARSARVPVVAIVGSIGDDAEPALRLLDRCVCATPPGTPPAQAMAGAAGHLRAAAAAFLREWTASGSGGPRANE